MKRVLLIGMILAICILAFPQGVAADGSAVVTAVVSDYLDCGASGDALTWGLTHVPPDNQLSNALHLTLTSSLPWEYDVSGSNNGYLHEYGGGSYLTYELHNPLKINDQAVTGSDAMLAESPDPSYEWSQYYNYNQFVAINDEAANYRIDLTFTCSNP